MTNRERGGGVLLTKLHIEYAINPFFHYRCTIIHLLLCRVLGADIASQPENSIILQEAP